MRVRNILEERGKKPSVAIKRFFRKDEMLVDRRDIRYYRLL